MICSQHGRVGGGHARRLLSLVALELVVDLVGALRDQEQAAHDQDQVAPAHALPMSGTVNSGSVRLMIQERLSSSRIRITIASAEPDPVGPRLLVGRAAFRPGSR